MKIDKVTQYMADVVRFPLTAHIPEDAFCEEELDLKGAFFNLGDAIAEFYEFSMHIAKGELQYVPARVNAMSGPLKDLQSTLRHLTWQAGCVADGDYGQKVDYLGDFSISFNRMIQQLKEREDILKENVRINEELAKNERQLLEAGLQRQVDHYDQLTKSMEDIRSYRHDMKNHLLCIDSLIQEEDMAGAKEYIHAILEVFHNQQKLIQTQNPILDALLSEKLAELKKLHVQVDMQCDLRQRLKISNVDWCILFGNALDNAKEALMKVDAENRHLWIRMKHHHTMLVVEMKNTMVGDVKVKGRVLETSKEDTLQHGIGLSNIMHTVDTYNGSLDIEVKQGIFKLLLFLNDV